MQHITQDLTQLPLNKRRLLELLMLEEGVDLARLPIPPRQFDSASFPLSFAQQRLWFLDNLEPGMPFYNMPLAVRLNGRLRVHLLERALSELVRRHEALRTSFPSVDGEPMQVIAPPQPLAIAIEDLSALAPAERDAEVRHRASREASISFDLEHGPLLHLKLLRLQEHDHVLLLTMHHIISDGWSMGIMVQELAALYTAFVKDAPSPLPELTVQYADFALWQRRWLTGPVLERQLSYWRSHLSGNLPVLSFPTDKPRPRLRSNHGAALPLALSTELSQQLKALCQQRGVTMFMLLLAAWQVLLSRYSGQEDICVGTPIANRNRAETEGLIGFFVNTLVMRTDLSGNPTFGEILERVREVCLGAYGHQDVPFEKLVEELEPEREMGRTPLFQTMMVLQNAPQGTLELPDLTLHSVSSSSEIANFDLTLSLSETEGGLYGELSYSTELYEAGSMRRLMQHFIVLLESMARDTGQRISEVRLLRGREREQVLVEWNETGMEYERERRIEELFEEQVERTPEAVALVFDDEQLTYRQLNQRANQLARFLREQGVKPETIVGLLLDRSADMIVSILAVLKAGGAYLPLEVSYPPERLSYMLADSEARLVLTRSRFLSNVPATGAQVVCVDGPAPWNAESVDNLALSHHALQLAYIIYTSGSTGKPKGVMIHHGSLCNFTFAAIYAHGFGHADRVLQFASFSFDTSIEEIFPTLCSGATLVLRTDEMIGPAADFLRHCERLQLTLLDLPTAFWHELAASMQREQLALPASVRRVIIGGERAVRERLAQWLEAGGSTAQLVNTYGPTESTVVATLCEVRPEQLDLQRELTIGRPLANTRAYIVDRSDQPAPIGVAGELLIGGAGLARGYLRRAELTAERFMPDPFGQEPGARLYRTGDLVRYRADGEIEYLGRIDEQVKIRGFRIELGEIETTLASHESVRECVVVAREDNPGEKRLAAYIVPEERAEADARQWRSHLQERLPEYMIPSSFVILDELPLTPNGKLDRHALPAPSSLSAADASAAVTLSPPRSPLEQLLLSVWSDLLSTDLIGIHDNFFSLGGHSLLATRLISRLRQLCQVELPLRTLFESPTIAGLALEIEHRLRMGESAEMMPPLLPRSVSQRAPHSEAEAVDEAVDEAVEGGTESWPLSFAQERLWFLEQLMPGSAMYLMPLAVRLVGALKVEALEQTISEIVRRHEVLRTSFPVLDGVPRQLISPAEALNLQIEELRGLTPEARLAEAERLAREEAQTPFDLSRGPLLRVRLLQLAKDEHVVLLTMHHIVSDGWSMGVIIQEVATLYETYSRGESSPLPELTVQYADFALWQRRWLTGPVLERQLSYWRSHLSGHLPILSFPTDKPRPRLRSNHGAALPLSLSTELSQQLKALCQQRGVTMFMLLLAAWQVLLSRYSGQEDICVGTPIANRNRAETEGLIGFFVNTLVMRTDLSGNPTFVEILERVREVCLGAYGHQDVPFEKLVEELEPEREMGRTPLFQTMMVLQNAPQGTLELPDLTLHSLNTGGDVVKFDLKLSVSESEGGLYGELSYSTELYEAESMRRLMQHFIVLLESMARDTGQRISEVRLLRGREREQVLVEWNETGMEYERERRIEELFEEQVKRTPEAVALVFDDQHLTYRELNRRANQLARFILSRSLHADAPLPLCLDRGTLPIISLLAALKAGHPYLPLDPAHPAPHLRFILDDANAPFFFTHTSLLNRFPQLSDRALCLDLLDAQLDSFSNENLSLPLSSDRLAYLIYTSGSTGRPKGVMIQHGSVLNLRGALYEAIYHRYGRELRVSLNAPLAFDSSVKQLVQLLDGHTLCVIGEEVRRDAELMVEVLAEQRVEVLDCTPSQLRLLRSAGLEERLRGQLKAVLVGGEEVDAGLWQEMRESEWVEYYNVYGPTECTVDTTVSRVRESEWEQGSIGRAIGNTEVYILDGGGEAVPVGVGGELHIGGAGLARGYWSRAELTAEKFIPHPYSREAGARLYRTGDLARYLSNGEVQFLGRIDEQVKVRGYRIELGEIETVLMQHEEVTECVVLALEREQIGKQLVAYVVGASTESFTISSKLRQHLKERLPEYMIPSTFVILDELPLTPNGKLDRKALPSPSSLSAADASAAVTLSPPRSPLEQLLLSVWSDLLSTDLIGIHDNFFSLGGHSLLATRLISRLRQLCQVELPLRTLFESPTIAGMALEIEHRLRTGESAEMMPPLLPRRALLPSRPAEAEDAWGEAVDAAVEGGTESWPLSFAQERLWFLEQLMPGSAMYLMPLAVRLVGDLQVEALEQTISEIVRRHEVLRTSFPVLDGLPRQLISPAQPLLLPLHSLAHLPAQERESEVRRRINAEAQTPFDLGAGPLLRVSLLHLAEDEHVVLLTMHHIISDGWSMSVLIREVSALYESYSRGEASPLPELAVQYADFAVWQRGWLSGEVLERQMGYWREQLGGELPVLELPADHPRSAKESWRGESVSFEVRAELTARLREVSREHGVTMFMLLLAAWQVLLSRYSGQEDICVGTPIANRNRAETEGLIGFFVNTLVMRTDLSGNPTFGELLERVREVCLGAYGHQDVPFEKLVEELEPEREMGRTPLFQTMMVMQNAPEERMEMSGVAMREEASDGEVAKFDVLMTVVEMGGGLRGAVQYAAEMYSEARMGRMVRHLEEILREVGRGGGRERIGELGLMGEGEREQILVQWNQTDVMYPAGRNLVELFEAQVERTPNAVALETETEQLCFRELNSRANQLAHYLQVLGVGPEITVGLFLPRTSRMVLAMLGILKAGAAYVPLDMSYPQERVAFMLEDAAVRVLLTEEHLVERLPAHGARVVCLDGDSEAITGESSETPQRETVAGNLAYVIYTSGSTGQPKGVAITHQSALTLLHWARHAFAPEHLAGVLAATSICFDLSVFEIFVPLSWGGKIILAENALQLPGLKNAGHVTLVNTVPSAMNELTRAGWLPSSVRVVNLAGEPLKRSLVQQVYKHEHVAQVWNLYGPSEDTTYSTGALLSGDASEAVTIGRPLANTRTYVLDGNLQPVPVGVTGELYISGEGLARGYLNRPELTAEKFIPYPFSNTGGERMYATGDLARYRSDGSLDFLGRRDYQVKVRGYRIELEEIEAELRKHEAVRDAVVLARDDEAGDKRLAAYVVFEDALNQPGANELRARLRERLPEYMIPSSFILLDELPLTPNGKLDRKALPAPERARGESDDQYVAPRNFIELKLARIWEETLGVERVGVKDDFFKLGGHSLLAVRLMTRIHQSLGRSLPLSALFQGATIERMAQLLSLTESVERVHPALVGIQPDGSASPFFCVHAVGGNVLSYVDLSRRLGPEQPFYGLEARGLDGQHAPATSIEEMAADYIEAIRALQPEGPYLLGGWSMGGMIALEMVQQLHAQNQEVAILVLLDTVVPARDAEPENELSDLLLMASFAEELGLSPDQLDLSLERLSQLKLEEQLAYALDQAKARSLVPPDMERAVINGLFQVFKANMLAHRKYVPQAPPCPTVLLKASEHFNGEGDEALERWKKIDAGRMSIHLVPGDHTSMLREPQVEILASHLKAGLDEAHEMAACESLQSSI
jgi:amino acid adenylation domain-containing protein